jgi:hypothetical protein
MVRRRYRYDNAFVTIFILNSEASRGQTTRDEEEERRNTSIHNVCKEPPTKDTCIWVEGTEDHVMREGEE